MKGYDKPRTGTVMKTGQATARVNAGGMKIPYAKIARSVDWKIVHVGDLVGLEWIGDQAYIVSVLLFDQSPTVLPNLEIEPITVSEDYYDVYLEDGVSGGAAELDLDQLGRFEGPHIGLYAYEDGAVIVIVLEAADTANVPYFSVGVNNFEENSRWLRIGYADAANIYMSGGTGGTEEHIDVVVQSECLEGASDGTLYIPFGDQGTDGSWRVIRDGNNLVHQRRESSVWVTKHTITP